MWLAQQKPSMLASKIFGSLKHHNFVMVANSNTNVWMTAVRWPHNIQYEVFKSQKELLGISM